MYCEFFFLRVKEFIELQFCKSKLSCPIKVEKKVIVIIKGVKLIPLFLTYALLATIPL
jgi:hypothetical protein